MAIKESSDELNPTVVTGAPIRSTKPARSAKDYLALAVGTCGVGYFPLAPGTWGSLLGLGIYLAVRGLLMKVFFGAAIELRFNLFHLFYAINAFQILFAIILALAGAWAGSRIERLGGVKDPSKVVIDEVVGQYIALLPIPFMIDAAWWSLVLAFVLFRLFDIVKPYPARKLESLHGGLGIMGDDIVAGVYAGAAVMLAVSIGWLI